MIYELPPLPYGINDLAPVISQETIEYHYGKHEQTYIDNLNKLIEGTPFADKPLEEIIKEADGALFNNASQAWNHIFYFFTFSPNGKKSPQGKLAEAINKLPCDLRDIVLLSYFANMPDIEIAKHLDLSYWIVFRARIRALKRLKAIISTEGIK